MVKLQEVTGLDPLPRRDCSGTPIIRSCHVWIPFALIGVVAAVALWIFGRMARRWSDMNA